MSDEMDKKAKALLDGEQAPETANEPEKRKTPLDPFEILRDLTRGTLKLMKPIRAHGQDVTEIKYDFCSLTSLELMEALDSAPVSNMMAVSNRQALALFAATAAKFAPIVEEDGMKTRLFDEKDIEKNIGPADAVEAVQLAKLFYIASSRAGSANISKG